MLGAAAVIVLAAAATAAGTRLTRPGDRPPTALGDRETRELDIAFYRRRLVRDSSATDLAQLARLYLQRARESGGDADILLAEKTARRSLGRREGHNVAARMVLALSLLAQHRFTEAGNAAEWVVATDSTLVSARALLAEIQLELGRYEEASRSFGMLRTYQGDLSVAPRLARWEELRGRPQEARRLLRAAREEARRRHGIPAEQLAWFQLRLGELALRHGRLREAEAELRAGLVAAPSDYRLHEAMARLELARGRWSGAVEFGKRAAALAQEPTALALVSTAYAAQGDSLKALEYDRAMRTAVRTDSGPFHRAWALYLLEHDREVPAVLARAREDLRQRPDVYGYDLLAWALYKSRRYADAEAPMRRALRLGTRDAMLEYHAGMIDLARGEASRAARHLARALEINPSWHPFEAAAARAALKRLRASQG